MNLDAMCADHLLKLWSDLTEHDLLTAGYSDDELCNICSKVICGLASIKLTWVRC